MEWSTEGAQWLQLIAWRNPFILQSMIPWGPNKGRVHGDKPRCCQCPRGALGREEIKSASSRERVLLFSCREDIPNPNHKANIIKGGRGFARWLFRGMFFIRNSCLVCRGTHGGQGLPTPCCLCRGSWCWVPLCAAGAGAEPGAAHAGC